jgi:glutamate/tyrosine decarboxylase-like PLP-dependent enzyme
MNMKIAETKLPKYQRLIRQKMRPAFPLSSSRGMGELWRMLDQIRPALNGLDLDRPSLPELGATDGSRKVLDQVLSLFNGLPNWAHALTQKNLMPPTTAVSVVTAFLTALFNPDVCSTEFSGTRLAEAEEKVVRFLSELVGYDPRISYGFFTYGGTFALQYGILLALEKASPGRYLTGRREDVKIICSDSAHFSIRGAAGSLGVGTRNVVRVKTNENDEMSLSELEQRGNEILARGEKIACVVATLGTTDTFGLDNLLGIARVRDKWVSRFGLEYPISIHADAAVGWAWNFFRDYDFAANPLQFPKRTLEAIRKIVKRVGYLKLADTISLNPHKYGYAPIPSSFILFRENGRTLAPLKRQSEDMPQLYSVGARHPGAYTMETTRFAGGVISTLANLMVLGREGYQAILGQVVEMGLQLRERLATIENIRVINNEGAGGATIFYFSLPGQSLAEQNALNKRVLDYLQAGTGDSAINLSSTFTKEGRIVLKSLIISPFITPQDIEKIREIVSRAAQKAGG